MAAEQLVRISQVSATEAWLDASVDLGIFTNCTSAPEIGVDI